MQLLDGLFRVFHDGTFSDFQLKKCRIEAGLVQDLSHSPIDITTTEQTAGDIDRDGRNRDAFCQPCLHLPTGSIQYPGIDIGDKSVLLGNRDEVARRHHATGRVLPAHQRFDRANTPGHQVVNRLVEHPQLVLLDRLTQLAGQLHPLLGVGGQLFGVQRKPFAAIGLGFEQRRISVAQQLLGS